jgi:MFS transporter, ACS family, tartrate transporter
MRSNFHCRDDMTESSENPGSRARRRIALRLLPFAFLMYLVSYVDRANLSFANLRMSTDLGFSDRIYGLGAGMFFIGYVLLEIPGAVIVERWSARKWMARIMLTWGLVTIVTAFIQTAQQFYVARFLLGAAEASFFPGMIVYLTHWFRASDRGKAIAALYTAIPTASVAGSLLASWLLKVHWGGIAGWRWIFIVEGIPAILLGIVAVFYLTDRPQQARWLPEDERTWIMRELEAELQAKKNARQYTIWQAFCDKRVLLLIIPQFIHAFGALSALFWIPTFLKRISGLPGPQVALWVALPGLVGIAALLVNGWHSDKSGERRWHAAVPLLFAGVTYSLVAFTHSFPVAMALLVAGGCFYAYYPAFWPMPTTFLSESAAAACFGLINSIAHIGGFIGPWVVGYLNDWTNGMAAGFLFIGTSYLLAGSVIPAIRIRTPQPIAAPVLLTKAGLQESS